MKKLTLWKIKWILPFFFLLMITASLQAQETGPLMMKQELGYTLGGGVFGAGLGVVVWFMDPLNPNVTLKSTVKNGFIAGTALGALFGFYMLQNAIIVPSQNQPCRKIWINSWEKTTFYGRFKVQLFLKMKSNLFKISGSLFLDSDFRIL